jgi:Zn-dependent M28 family amino/carboxypeptidase
MTNLVGVVRGTSPGLDPLLLGAHYDSVIAAPCADDNAAGVAIMLEIAARLAAQPLQRDVIVAAFDAEEPPYFLGPDMGSNRFVANTLNGPVHLAVILDLVGHRVRIPGLAVDPALVFVTGAECHPALPDLLGGLDLPIAAAAQRRVGDFSDYAAFRQAGAPYLFFSCGEWEHYHRVSDHPDLLDYSKMARLAGDLERVVRRADTVDTAYHAMHDCTDFEVATLERTIGAKALTAIARTLGRSGYRTAADLDVIAGALRGSLH